MVRRGLRTQEELTDSLQEAVDSTYFFHLTARLNVYWRSELSGTRIIITYAFSYVFRGTQWTVRNRSLAFSSLSTFVSPVFCTNFLPLPTMNETSKEAGPWILGSVLFFRCVDMNTGMVTTLHLNSIVVAVGQKAFPFKLFHFMHHWLLTFMVVQLPYSVLFVPALSFFYFTVYF